MDKKIKIDANFVLLFPKNKKLLKFSISPLYIGAFDAGLSS